MEKKAVIFSTGVMNIGIFSFFMRPEIFRHPICFRTFLIEEKNIYFRVFSYDLEISESFKNATHNALIHSQKHPLKKLQFFFFHESSDPPGSWKWVGE